MAFMRSLHSCLKSLDLFSLRGKDISTPSYIHMRFFKLPYFTEKQKDVERWSSLKVSKSNCLQIVWSFYQVLCMHNQSYSNWKSYKTVRTVTWAVILLVALVCWLLSFCFSCWSSSLQNKTSKFIHYHSSNTTFQIERWQRVLILHVLLDGMLIH